MFPRLTITGTERPLPPAPGGPLRCRVALAVRGGSRFHLTSFRISGRFSHNAGSMPTGLQWRTTDPTPAEAGTAAAAFSHQRLPEALKARGQRRRAGAGQIRALVDAAFNRNRLDEVIFDPGDVLENAR